MPRDWILGGEAGNCVFGRGHEVILGLGPSILQTQTPRAVSGAPHGKFDTKFAVPGTGYGKLDTKFAVPGTGYGKLDTKFAVPGTGYGKLDTKFAVPGTGYGKFGGRKALFYGEIDAKALGSSAVKVMLARAVCVEQMEQPGEPAKSKRRLSLQ